MGPGSLLGMWTMFSITTRTIIWWKLYFWTSSCQFWTKIKCWKYTWNQSSLQEYDARILKVHFCSFLGIVFLLQFKVDFPLNLLTVTIESEYCTVIFFLLTFYICFEAIMSTFRQLLQNNVAANLLLVFGQYSSGFGQYLASIWSVFGLAPVSLGICWQFHLSH